DHFGGQSDLQDLVGTFRPGFRVLQNESRFFEDRNIKKVRFKEGHNEAKVDLVRNLELSPNMSWKDKFLGVGSASSGKEHMESSDGSDGVPDCPVMDEIFFSTTTVLERGHGLDQIDSRTKDRFARMAVFINLNRPLVSQLCHLVVMDPFSESGKEPTIVNPREVKIGVGGAVGMTYRPWTMV
ncbi:hypothetical protein Goarm_002022, partial [Gossypium armourianum]|nr:hypothetical protein [Gossypium armourianum]